MSFQDSVITAGAIATIIGVAATITFKILDRKKKAQAEQPTFRFETFVDNGVRKIRVLHPNRMLQSCKILFDDTPLIWDGVNVPTKTIEEGGGGNVVVPDSIFSERGKVKVEANRKVIKEIDYKDIDRAEP